MSVADDVFGSSIRSRGVDNDEIDEGFGSRPTSSLDKGRLSSSESSSEDEVFWGAGLKSVQCQQAEARLEVYKATSGDINDYNHFHKFKKRNPLPCSRKAMALSRQKNEKECDENVAGEDVGIEKIGDANKNTDTSGMISSNVNPTSALSSPLDLSKCPSKFAQSSGQSPRQSPQRSPLNLKRKLDSIDEDSSAFDSSVPTKQGLAPIVRPLDTVLEDGAEGEEEEEEEEEEEDAEDKQDEVSQVKDADPLFVSGIEPIENSAVVISNDKTPAGTLVSGVDPVEVSSTVLPNVSPKTASVDSQGRALLLDPTSESPVDPSASLYCSTIADPDAQYSNTSSLFAPTSSTPRASFSNVSSEEDIFDDGLLPASHKTPRSRPSVVLLEQQLEAEERKAKMNARLLELKRNNLQMNREMRDLDEEPRKKAAADSLKVDELVERVTISENKVDGDGVEMVDKGQGLAKGIVEESAPVLITSNHPILESPGETALTINHPRFDAKVDDDRQRQSDLDDQQLSDFDDRQSDASFLSESSDVSHLNSSVNTTLNSTVFGMSCRESTVFGKSGDQPKSLPNSTAPSRGIATSASTPFAGSKAMSNISSSMKGMSFRPSPLKSPSLRPAATSSKGATSTTSTVTPGRSVAWKEKMVSSPANSSPSTAACVTPGRSALKKSTTKTFAPKTSSISELRCMTPPNRKVQPGKDHQNEGSPSLKAPSNALQRTPNRLQPPNKSLFGSKSPAASPVTPKGSIKAQASGVPKTPNGHLKPSSSFSLMRSPAAAASRGAMMARSPGGVSGGKSVASPGASLMAPRSPGAPLKTNTSENVAVNVASPLASQKSRVLTPSRIGVPSPGGKRPATPTTSGVASKIGAGTPTFVFKSPRPITPSSVHRSTPSAAKSLTPKTLSFKK